MAINRETSWLEFNGRVLEEAGDRSNPLLERLKFLAIFGSNLDEFFEIRMAGLQQQVDAGVEPQDYGADGLGPREQLAAAEARVRDFVSEQYRLFNEDVIPALADVGMGWIRGTPSRTSITRASTSFSAWSRSATTSGTWRWCRCRRCSTAR
jgi:polyphosphate kinase